MDWLATARSAGKHDLQAAGFLRGRLYIGLFRDRRSLLVVRVAGRFAVRDKVLFPLFVILR